MEYFCSNPDELAAPAKLIADAIRNSGQMVVLLDAPMGAGKTTLTSRIIGELDKSISPTSPTFTIINQYSDNIYHIDLYRVNPGEVTNVGITDLFTDGNILFVEWPSQEFLVMLGVFYDGPVLKVEIAPDENDIRHITVKEWRR
ncbi:MAG: tRNA (adenosine(37)-N6)-threonylcarbamoyltransferase complex ATPase subunit type 1 TsaE [Firmicutes bacterium]|nr:tRNA (adenosine(37)-N6)-threonylcarbamoyltransferase complex ATPase subunit type 1 TsaE [Bacillota bacterium]